MLDEFQTNYKLFQTTLLSDMIYYKSFKDYIGKLIKIVYQITHSIRKKSKHLKFERVIINDIFGILRLAHSVFFLDNINDIQKY